MKRLKMPKRGLEKIYLVAQNVDGLKGRYLTAAVVVATSEEEAIDRLLDYASEEDFTCCPERLKAMEVGVLTKRPDPSGLGINQRYLMDTKLLAMEVGEDEDIV